MTASVSDRSLFVCGVSGSSSELIADALGRHGSLHMVDGRSWLRPLLAPSAAGVGASPAKAPDDIVGTLSAEAASAGKPACVVLAPEGVASLDPLRLLCPDATVVQVLRDPRQIAALALAEGRTELDVAAVAERWLIEIAAMLEWAHDHPDQTVTVGADAFFQSPLIELTRLCLALDLNEDALAMASETRPYPQRVHWQDQLQLEQVEAIEAIAQPTLTLLGYAPAAGGRSLRMLQRQSDHAAALVAEVERLREVALERDALRQEVEALRHGKASGPNIGPNMPPEDSATVAAYQALMDEIGPLRAKAARVDELTAELHALRYKAAQYSMLTDQLPQLRFKAREYDKLKKAVPQPRGKATVYERDAQELQRLHFKADAYDRLAQELKSLRYKARRYDEVVDENLHLRYKARRYDFLRKWLAPLRPAVRLIFRIRRGLTGKAS